MLSGVNKTDGNTLERFLTPYQYSTLPLMETKLMLNFQFVGFFKQMKLE